MRPKDDTTRISFDGDLSDFGYLSESQKIQLNNGYALMNGKPVRLGDSTTNIPDTTVSASIPTFNHQMDTVNTTNIPTRRERISSPLEMLDDTSPENSSNTVIETEEEDPLQFINGFINIYEHMAKDENYKTQHISVAEYAEKVQSILLGIKAGLEKCAYYVKPSTVDGCELDIGNYKLKRTQIEDMYLVQPLEKVRLDELAEISRAIQKQQGALNNKAIIVVPYDIRVLKATLKE